MTSDLSKEHTELILDGSKIQWHQERIDAWERGERIAPITIDMSLTRACNLSCFFCYSITQENARKSFTKDTVTHFMEDCAELGVKGISLVSDGESTLSPHFVEAVEKGSAAGISMAVGTNGLLLTEEKLRKILPHLTYLRFNFSGGEELRYESIMGAKPGSFKKICEIVKLTMKLKNELKSKCTVGLQMVVMPEFQDQVLPLALLGKNELRPDYLILKHCSDDEDGFLGVKYDDYKNLYEDFRKAETMSDEEYFVKVKWKKIEANGKRSYSRCYGPPFILQISGSGLVAPCGQFFNEQYKKYWMGNIVTERFKEIVRSDRYWEVVNHLASPNFNAQKQCGSLCLHHLTNEYLDGVKKGLVCRSRPCGPDPDHVNFI